MQVAVVMRTRWRIGMLARALRSVLSQTHPRWFLQIVNDGGPARIVEDEVAPYRHLLTGRLGILHLPEQRGMEAASNAGIAAAPGDVIAIHDDDDNWHPEFLERMLAWMQECGHAVGICRTKVVREVWDGERHVTRSAEEFGPWGDSITAADLALRNHFPPISMLFLRTEYQAVGPFDEALPALGDWHFNRRIASRRPIPVLAETLACWRLRDAKDPAPNSPEAAHWRSHHAVAAWPDGAAMPEYFGQAQQVRVRPWPPACGPFLEHELDSAGWCNMNRLGEPLLGSGVHLLRIQPADDLGSTVGAVGVQVHFSARFEGGHAESLPVRAASGDAITMILNARSAVQSMGLFWHDGRPCALKGPVRAIRLANPLSALQRFAGAPRLPDVLCIGAQRAGTTWLHSALQGHPQVWACGIKEFHHFDWDGTDGEVAAFRLSTSLARIAEVRDSDMPEAQRESAMRMCLRHGLAPSRTWEGYAALFESAPRDLIACDFTPAYATLAEPAVAEILRVMPDIKVILMLRDPVTRALSGALHELHRRGVMQPTMEDISAACASPENELRTDYLRTLRIWERHLPPHQLLVLFHDDIASDPERVLRRTCEFLGISATEEPCIARGATRSPVNRVHHQVPWTTLGPVKEELSRRWLPMLDELEARYGGPVSCWRAAAQARIGAAEASARGAGAGRGHTVIDNLAQWDRHHPWPRGGDEWTGQAKACGVPYAEWKEAVLSRYLPLMREGGTILEIGPGHGRWSEPLLRHAGLLVLCDVSPNCLDVCRERLTGLGRIRTHLSQGADLPPDLSGSVDAVWSYDCLVHVAPEECARYIGEIARVLKPGGVAVLHHSHRAERIALLAALSRMAMVLRRLVRPSAPASTDVGWRSRITRDELSHWARSEGLAVERQESTWMREMPGGPVRVGVPRLGDCITVLRRP